MGHRGRGAAPCCLKHALTVPWVSDVFQVTFIMFCEKLLSHSTTTGAQSPQNPFPKAGGSPPPTLLTSSAPSALAQGERLGGSAVGEGLWGWRPGRGQAGRRTLGPSQPAVFLPPHCPAGGGGGTAWTLKCRASPGEVCA